MNELELSKAIKTQLEAAKAEYESLECPAHISLSLKTPHRKRRKGILWFAAAAALFLIWFLPHASNDLQRPQKEQVVMSFSNLPVLPSPASGIPSLMPNLTTVHEKVSPGVGRPNYAFKMPSQPTVDQFPKN